MLERGTTLLHYRLADKIGEGGMGQVWRASDTTLGREVAIKVLPAAFLQDPERLARLEREAKVLASLNHANVATVHGFHETQGLSFLAMELVPGEDLTQRIARGAVPIEDALPIALQIAEALEFAHERGVVHRDLKPANVRITPDGQVKVLDFGLAKAMFGEASSGGPPTRTPTILPTVTSAGTAVGMILGTAAYMSPEQAKGKPVDRRADLWALGCVLYEMLTGRRPFDGETVSETLASVLKEEPDWGALPGGTPRSVRRLLRRCLEKDPSRRLRSAGDATLELRGGEEPERVEPAPFRSGWLPWAVAALFAVALAAALALRPTGGAPMMSRHVEIAVPSGHLLSDLAPPALAPNGKWIVFSSSSGVESAQLLLRSLDSFEITPVPGTEGAILPFWSPDSRHVGYFVPGELRRFDVATRNSQLVCACAPWGRGATWAADGTILFAAHANSGIAAVPADGGEPVALTEPDPAIPDASHRFPVLLPDAEHFLFTLWTNNAEALAEHGGIYVASRNGGSSRRLLPDASLAVVAPPSVLLFHRGGQLVATRFDPESLTVGSEATTVSPVVRFGTNVGAVYASASSAGDLLFAGGEETQDLALDLVWLDRRGAATPATDRPLGASVLELSPDGARFVAVVSPQRTGADDLWVGEFARGTVVRLTSGMNDSFAPRWSPDRAWIAFANLDTGNDDIYRIRADGTGAPERLFDAKEFEGASPTDWSADGRFLFFDGFAKAGRRKTQVWQLDLASKETKVVLDSERAAIGSARLSPDGRWLAYVSNESGQDEVFVQSFPGLDRKWQISRQGGIAPHWRRDGGEIVFVGGSVRIFAVPIAPRGDDLDPGAPELLFTSARSLIAFTPAADHSRFLTATLPAGRTEPPLRLVLDWGAGFASAQTGNKR